MPLAMTGQIELVPGRECGACNACCTHLLIDDPAMTKAPGSACRHWAVQGGCTIYANRPGACREYHCGWRCLADLNKTWRPDRSGVMINFRTVADGGAERIAAHLIVIGGLEAARRPGFAGLAASLVDGGTAVHMVMPGNDGGQGRQALLNPLIAEAVAARDLVRVRFLIEQLCDRLTVPLAGSWRITQRKSTTTVCFGN